MRTKTLVQVLVIVLLLGIAGAQVFRLFRGPHIDLSPYLALGTVAAEEASKLVGGRGGLVLVVPDTGPDRDPVLDAQVDAFRSALKSHRGVAVKAVEPVRLNPFLSMQTGGAIPPDQYVTLRRKHADAAGVVLFIAFPPLSEEEQESIGKGPTRVMVISAALPNYADLLQRGAFDLAIVSSSAGTEEAPAKAGSVREVFDRDYRILRREAGGPGR